MTRRCFYGILATDKYSVFEQMKSQQAVLNTNHDHRGVSQDPRRHLIH
jgi:hypothetical protein